MSAQDANRQPLAAVPSPDSRRTCTSRQISPERRTARAEFSTTIAGEDPVELLRRVTASKGVANAVEQQAALAKEGA